MAKTYCTIQYKVSSIRVNKATVPYWAAYFTGVNATGKLLKNRYIGVYTKDQLVALAAGLTNGHIVAWARKTTKHIGRNGDGNYIIQIDVGCDHNLIHIVKHRSYAARLVRDHIRWGYNVEVTDRQTGEIIPLETFM